MSKQANIPAIYDALAHDTAAEDTTHNTAAHWHHHINKRATIITIAIVATAVVVALFALSFGDYPMSLGDVVQALVSNQGIDTTIVTQWRAPRVVAALILGAALAVSGALFQTLTNNPLGSPDVIGFSTGSYTGVLVATMVGVTSSAALSGAALTAGIATALIVYALSWRNGVGGFRLIVIGIAVTAMLAAINTYLLLRMNTNTAMSASIWATGSLNLTNWNQVAFSLPCVGGLLVAVIVLSRPMRQLELGDDAAKAHGVAVEPIRLALIIVGVGLVAVATAVTGPIAFISLSAPQIAKRLVGTAGIPLLASACGGSLLLLCADMAAQHIASSPIPVGVVTIVFGGAYLLVLLFQEARHS